MASSSVTYTSGTNNFDITFGYLRDTHVIVQVGSTQYDINDNYFTIDTTSTPKVVLNTPVSDGTTVKILRKSLGKNNDQGFLVDFVDGSVLTEKQQDEAYQHNYYINQESKEGNLSVATPILDTDAANKAYVDGRLVAIGAGTVSSVTAGNGLSGGTITTSGTVSIPTSGGDLNINSGKVGIGGDADGTYKAKVTGDLLVSESGDHTILTVENTNTSGTNHATAVIKGPGNATLQLYDTDTTGTNDSIYNLGSNGGMFHIGLIHDDHVTTTGLMNLHPTGSPEFPNLPATDPSTAGYLWNNGGVVSVSGSSGNVGIGGAANSSYLLAVNGDAVILGTGGSDTELLIKDTEAGHSARMVLETGSSGAETDIILKNLANGAVRDVNGVSTNIPRFLIRNDGSEEKTKFMTQDNTGSQDSTLSSMEILHSNGNIVLPNLPTSASGLATGTVYNDSGTLKIVT